MTPTRPEEVTRNDDGCLHSTRQAEEDHVARLRQSLDRTIQLGSALTDELDYAEKLLSGAVSNPSERTMAAQELLARTLLGQFDFSRGNISLRWHDGSLHRIKSVGPATGTGGGAVRVSYQMPSPTRGEMFELDDVLTVDMGPF